MGYRVPTRCLYSIDVGMGKGKGLTLREKSKVWVKGANTWGRW